jgi:hypothetical protein
MTAGLPGVGAHKPVLYRRSATKSVTAWPKSESPGRPGHVSPGHGRPWLPGELQRPPNSRMGLIVSRSSRVACRSEHGSTGSIRALYANGPTRPEPLPDLDQSQPTYPPHRQCRAFQGASRIGGNSRTSTAQTARPQHSRTIRHTSTRLPTRSPKVTRAALPRSWSAFGPGQGGAPNARRVPRCAKRTPAARPRAAATAVTLRARPSVLAAAGGRDAKIVSVAFGPGRLTPSPIRSGLRLRIVGGAAG